MRQHRLLDLPDPPHSPVVHLAATALKSKVTAAPQLAPSLVMGVVGRAELVWVQHPRVV